MKTTYRQLLISILTIAGYPQDKEKFAVTFERLNIFEAIAYIFDTLPKEQQARIKERIDDPYEIVPLIPQEDYKKAYIRVSKEALFKFIGDISHTLNSGQKAKISALLAEF